ncbi:uncharacterized protein BP5553_00688 [Venustampulla echinocandica]|uniref:Uncharacterized protein n=1 Tax=Venustampulla echinocandica TaxID=2656787 RepID=A0A370TYV2_9HELO|nr:uncharacterized protein BP5553_00688 [Venustampulla echinocandica]RDL40709.1 hypothetical protein BP5553_00688 [Venustampulla echinocandica]
MAAQTGAVSSTASEEDVDLLSAETKRPSSSIPPSNLQYRNGVSENTDDMATSNSLDEGDESLIELSISEAAMLMKSPSTPAIEKAAAMDDVNGGGFYDSDAEIPTPPAVYQAHSREEQSSDAFADMEGLSLRQPAEDQSQPIAGENVPFPKLPSPKPETSALPGPWYPGSRAIQTRRTEPQSALAGVFNNARTRSRSASLEGLKKFLPKGLPSMPQIGHFFGSSNTSHSQGPAGASRDIRRTRPSSMFVPGATPRGGSSPRPRGYSPIFGTTPESCSENNLLAGPQRSKSIRRVTSDDSLLYHSLSRASSLGDDSRFENQNEQVNSRIKAIRDTLQDRSSFRMPQMPSMPSMPRVAGFNFNMNFLNANNSPARWRTDTDLLPEILPGHTKDRPSALPNPAVASGMVGAAASQPRTAMASLESVANAQSVSAMDRALESLTGDVVVMGGYRGSILRSTKTDRQVWVPVKVGLNIRKVDLEVGLEPEDEERMEESIYPSGMLQNIGPVDISKRLFKRLSECENARNGKLRVWNYGYDWRLSPHILSRKLAEFLETLPCNQPSKDGSVQGNAGAMVIAHSLGGLITRHVVNHRPELFSGVVYAGVPQSCVNILGPLRNGDAVMLSSRVLTAQVNFTLRTSFVLLPEHGRCFVDIRTKEQYPVDFFSLDDWIKYRLSPCTDPPLPPRNQSPGGLGGLLNLSSNILSVPIPGKKVISSSADNGNYAPHAHTMRITRAADIAREVDHGTDRTLAPKMDSKPNSMTKGIYTNQSISTALTIPRSKAIAYLERTLAETKKFKQELRFRPSLSKPNRYPPLAVIYGKSIPTCYGAKVDGREGIPCSDSYDNLAFASGDGVCLAREAMLPEGYKTVNHGRIKSDRGHVTLLGDLEAVGKALEAVLKGRAKGIGLGLIKETTDSE